MTEDIKKQIADINAMATEPASLETAVRLSGEMLAQMDARWTRAVNTPGEDMHSLSETLEDLLEMGICHANCLFAAGLHKDAFSLCMMLMLAPATRGSWKGCETRMLALCTISYMSLLSLLNELPDDEVSHTHLPVIVRYIASIGYGAYKASADTQSIWHKRSGAWLNDAIANGMVEYPAVDVNGSNCPSNCPDGIIGDLLGRCRAMGLLSD